MDVRRAQDERASVPRVAAALAPGPKGASAPAAADPSAAPDTLASSAAPAATAPDYAAVLSAVRAACQNGERAEDCAAYLQRFAPPLQAALTPWARVLVWSAATERDGADTEGLVTPRQAARALEAAVALTPSQRARLADLLTDAETPAAQAVLLKELGAPGLDPAASLVAVERLAPLVRGRDLAWLTEHTTGYGLLGRPGIRQAFTTGCVGAGGLMALAETRPSVALAITLDARPPDDPRSFAGRYVREVMQEGGATAVPTRLLDRLLAGALLQRGTNMVMTTYMPKLAEQLGASYRPIAWSALSAEVRAGALDVLAAWLRQGCDLPVETIRDGDLERGHSVWLVDVSLVQGHRTWRLFDPATGKTHGLDDGTLLSGRVRALARDIHALWVPA